jgi:hypothetical protein
MVCSRSGRIWRIECITWRAFGDGRVLSNHPYRRSSTEQAAIRLLVKTESGLVEVYQFVTSQSEGACSCIDI